MPRLPQAEAGVAVLWSEGLMLALQDGGAALQRQMGEPRQSVEEVKRVIAEARNKPSLQQPPDFNEEEYMDGDLMDEELVD